MLTRHLVLTASILLSTTAAFASTPQREIRTVMAETHEAETALFQHRPVIARRLINDAICRDEHLRQTCSEDAYKQIASELSLARGEIKSGLIGPANAELAKVRAPTSPGC